jgi:hypothetical protein
VRFRSDECWIDVTKLLKLCAVVVSILGIALFGQSDFASSAGLSALNAFGSGSCAHSASFGCDHISGSAKAGALGSGNFDFTIVIDAGEIPNGSGGFCSLASGIGALNGAATVTVDQVGILCDVGAGGGTQIFRGSFFVTGGTGPANGAVGTGSVIWSVDGTGKVVVVAFGAGAV